jgi:hypothetical protein
MLQENIQGKYGTFNNISGNYGGKTTKDIAQTIQSGKDNAIYISSSFTLEEAKELSRNLAALVDEVEEELNK